MSEKLDNAELPSLKPFETPEKPEKGMFRLIYGKTAVHTQGHTMNNPLLSELMPTNTVTINTKKAKQLGIAEGDLVEIAAADHSYCATVAAHISDHIPPGGRSFTVHGFWPRHPPVRPEASWPASPTRS